MVAPPASGARGRQGKCLRWGCAALIVTVTWTAAAAETVAGRSKRWDQETRPRSRKVFRRSLLSQVTRKRSGEENNAAATETRAERAHAKFWADTKQPHSATVWVRPESSPRSRTVSRPVLILT
ncbi:hypothetical protein CC79DRAFT_157118 [Sarocladium strictum]